MVLGVMVHLTVNTYDAGDEKTRASGAVNVWFMDTEQMELRQEALWGAHFFHELDFARLTTINSMGHIVDSVEIEEITSEVDSNDPLLHIVDGGYTVEHRNIPVKMV